MSHPARSGSGSVVRARLSGLSVVAVVLAALTLAVVLPQDGSASRSEDPERAAPMSGALGGLGCYPTPDPTPTPTPDPTPVAISTVALAAVVQGSTRSDVSIGDGPAPPDGPPGVDMSKWDGAVDMDLLRAAGIRFVITKATQGATHVDPWYSAHVAEARAVDIAVGSYHFFDYRQSGVRQADHFVDTMAANRALMDTLPPVVDVECSSSMGQADRVQARARLRALVDRVYQRTGRMVMIYTSAHMWGQVTGNDLTFGDNPLWVADWSHAGAPTLPRGWSRWAFWQYGPKPIPGIARRFDGNVAHGTEATVERLRSRPMVVAGGADLSRGGSLPIRIRSLDGMSLRTSIDDGSWTDWTERASADHVRLDGPDGERNVRVQARDGRGTLGPVVSDAITIDSKAPVVRGPRIGLRSGTVGLGAPGHPCASGMVGGGSDLGRGGWPAPCGLRGSEPDAPGCRGLGANAAAHCEGLLTTDSTPGTRCVLSASVTDLAGNKTTTGDIWVRVRAIQDKPSSALTYSRGWRALRSASAFGGTVRASTAANQWVRLRFRGSEDRAGLEHGQQPGPGPDHHRWASCGDGRPSRPDLRESPDRVPPTAEARGPLHPGPGPGLQEHVDRGTRRHRQLPPRRPLRRSARRTARSRRGDDAVARRASRAKPGSDEPSVAGATLGFRTGQAEWTSRRH